ncbi:MAG: dihydroneopterin aldolase [Gammaproteobacteria bacterium]|nr:dihydroneopterin aldolase [Gammaproteobacteria bacterium]
MDSLFIQALTVRCRIGVYDWEQRGLRPLTVDLRLDADFSAAAASDRLDETLNYATLADAIATLAGSRPFALIEHLAGEIAALALLDSRVNAVEVTVRKRGAVAEADAVGITLRRRR